MTGKIHILPDQQALNAAVAQAWHTMSNAAIAARGEFHVALSGGSTPKSLFQLLASTEWRDRFNWKHIHIYFGDERCVPADHPDSNYRMVREAMLDHLVIPAINVHRIVIDTQNILASAQAYEQVLQSHLPKTEDGIPQFDVMLQGVGGDGHTASLFPGTAILHERDKWVDAVHVEKLNAWRISVTFPIIDYARCIMMLVAGAGKAEIVHELLALAPTATPYPVQQIQPRGEMRWYLDSAAAALLPETLADVHYG
jgi:6-phosphogluconolactonase